MTNTTMTLKRSIVTLVVIVVLLALISLLGAGPVLAENLEAISFIKALNTACYGAPPDIIMRCPSPRSPS